MKKLILAVAVLLSVGTFAFAQPGFSSSIETPTTEVMQEDTFKEVTAASLNEKVQVVVSGYATGFEIKKLEYSETKKQTRVTLEDKRTKAVKVVILDEAGKEVKGQNEEQK